MKTQEGRRSWRWLHHWGLVGWVVIVTPMGGIIRRKSELAGKIMNSTFVELQRLKEYSALEVSSVQIHF